MVPKGTIIREKRDEEVTFSITNLSDAGQEGVSVLLCGTTKSGRSQLSSTFPDVLFIDADHGLNQPAVRKANPKIISINRGDETSRVIMDVLFKIQEKQAPFDKWKPKAICFDSITAICEHLEEECRVYDPESKSGDGRGDGLYLSDYNSIFSRAVRIIDYAKGLGLYFICIANVELNQDDLLGMRVESPAASGKKLPIHIPHAFDEVYYCGFDTVKKQYYISPEKTLRFKYAGTKNNVPKIFNPTFKDLEKYYTS